MPKVRSKFTKIIEFTFKVFCVSFLTNISYSFFKKLHACIPSILIKHATMHLFKTGCGLDSKKMQL